MKVVLIETVGNLGLVGDIVNVKPGYARNYLFPRKKAIAADEKSVKHVAHRKMVLEHKMKRAKVVAEEAQQSLSKQSVTIHRKVGEQEKLFGSVTAGDIEQALGAIGVTVSRKGITLDEPIKQIGKFEIPLKLDGGLEATITLEVAAEPA